jgi:hypothetical protein
MRELLNEDETLDTDQIQEPPPGDLTLVLTLTPTPTLTLNPDPKPKPKPKPKPNPSPGPSPGPGPNPNLNPHQEPKLEVLHTLSQLTHSLAYQEPKLEIFYEDPPEPVADMGAEAEGAAGPRPAAGAAAAVTVEFAKPWGEDFEKVKPGSTPYAQIEVVFNDKNLYASKQYYDPALQKGTINQIDPALLTYDFENPDAWEAFLRPEMRAEGKPVCFYSARRVSAGISQDRLRTMEQKIQGEIRSQLEMARPPGQTSCNTMKELVQELGIALELQEIKYVNPANEVGEQALKDFEKWQRKIKGMTPPKSRFKGQMINYAYTDEKKIRKHLLGEKNYHQSKEDGLEFLVAVKCFGYAGGVVSVWVYYAMLDKPDDDD